MKRSLRASGDINYPKIPTVIGWILDDGEIVSSNKSPLHKHLVHELPSGFLSGRSPEMIWRYNTKNKIVYWWPFPRHATSEEKFAVAQHLDWEYNYSVARHEMLAGQESDPAEFEDKYNKAHGLTYERRVMNEIRQMIIEGVKEKALEDFISQTIKGTEWEGKVFIAGGYVRDEFMGKDPKDLDLLVNAPNGGIEFAKWITKKVGAYRGGPDESPGSNPVIFPRFGTAKFNLRDVVHKGIDLSDMDIESVMPRKEQYTAGSRKPTVTGGELKDDVERRDFTVNSLLKDLSTGEILDLTGMGKDDIKKGIIRTPLNPDKIFTDDPLRMLRAIRFAVKYDWKLPLFMLRGLKKNAPQLKNISQERIRDELDKMLMTPHPKKAMKLLKLTGLMQFVIPEMVPAVKMTQNRYHKDKVFDHILAVLQNTDPVLVQRLMALFHDIGKTVTRTVDEKTGSVHFYGHELEGEKMVEDIMMRLKYPRALVDQVKLGVKNHMRLKQAGSHGDRIKDATLIKFRNEIGPILQHLLKVIHADNLAHADPEALRNQIAGVEKRLETLKDIPEKPVLPISGNDLQSELGLKPGPIFKDIMKAISNAWYARMIQNKNFPPEKRRPLSREEALKIAKHMAQQSV